MSSSSPASSSSSSKNPSPQQQRQQQQQQIPLSKLDISLLAGVATWSVPADHINLRWMAKQQKKSSSSTSSSFLEPEAFEPEVMRSCETMMHEWASLDPYELDVKGTELIRSPRSALAVLRHGVKVRDLCDSDTHAIHAASRKMKLTKQETMKRIELDRQRKDVIRNEVYENYQELCGSFTRQDLTAAVRRFLFKEELLSKPTPKANEGENNGEEQHQQREVATPNSNNNNNNSNNNQKRVMSAASNNSSRRNQQQLYNHASSSGRKVDAFSKLTCSPSHEARVLLRPEEVEDVVQRRDREALRLRKRLMIDANHRADRIVHELDLAEKLDIENNQADLGNERARQVLLERKREVQMKNEEREERARLKKELLKQQEEDKLRFLEEEQEQHKKKVNTFMTKRDKQAQAAKMAAIKAENKSRAPLTPTPKKLKMLNEALQFEEQQQQQQQQQQRPNTPNVNSSSKIPSSVQRGCGDRASVASSAATPNNQKQNIQKALEIDDLLTEWKVQNAKTEKLHRAFELGKKREEALFQAQKRRNEMEKNKELERKQTAKREVQRANTAAHNKQKIESRVSKSFGVLASRIDHAKHYVHEKDLERSEVVTSEFENRMERSKQQLDAQAQERRRKLIEKIYQEDAQNEWRDQRKERHELTSDAKRVMFTADLEDIEEDLERRRVVHRQVARENHLLRKTNLNAFHDLAAEEKKILVDLHLRNASA